MSIREARSGVAADPAGIVIVLGKQSQVLGHISSQAWSLRPWPSREWLNSLWFLLMEAHYSTKLKLVVAHAGASLLEL